MNPQENVWQFMHENRLSNRIVKFYDQIVDQRYDASHGLIDQPGRVISNGMRDWAYAPD
jgi:hypothetical protein